MKKRIATFILATGLCVGIAVPLTFAAGGQDTMQSSKMDHSKMSHPKKDKKVKKSHSKMSKMHESGQKSQSGKMGSQ